MTWKKGIRPENQKYFQDRRNRGIPVEVLEVWQAVTKTTTERDLSFLLDYNKLCRQRWGALDKDKEQLYGSRR